MTKQGFLDSFKTLQFSRDKLTFDAMIAMFNGEEGDALSLLKDAAALHFAMEQLAEAADRAGVLDRVADGA